MLEVRTDESWGDSDPKGCISCGNPAIVKGHPNALCYDCRQKFIKFPLPLWIKLFGAGIILIFLFSLYKIPKNIGIGIHLEKGKNALAQKKYLTAQRELQQVVNKTRDHLEAEGDLLIASFYNQDFQTMTSTLKLVENKNVEDQDLYSRVNDVLKKSNDYYSDPAFDTIIQAYGNDFTKIPDNILKRFVDSNPGSIYVVSGYANRLFSNTNEDKISDSLLQGILEKKPDYYPALITIAGIKRHKNEFDASLKYLDRLLEINKESVDAISSKSRTLLKMKRDKEALEVARAGFELDEKNTYAGCTLVLAYHFNNKPKEEAALMNKMALAKDPASIEILKYVKDIISGKEPFRN